MNASGKGSGCERRFAPLALKSMDETAGEFEGHAAIFSRRDMGGDVIMPGAFAKSLKKRGAGGVRMLFQHDPSEPVGVWEEIREDRRGLYVRGRLSPQVARAREIRSLMADGALDGLSIGYRAIKAQKLRGGGRRLLELDLWEISIVTFPMQPGARIDHIKGVHLPTRREMERWLVRDAGLSRSQARKFLNSGYQALASKQDAARQDEERLAGIILRAAEKIRHIRV